MSRYGAWTIPGSRETARLAWRARVNAATIRAKALAFVHPLGMLTSACPGCIALYEWQDAVSAPRPWRSPRRPDPRRNYSRAHRRVCAGCQRMSRWLRVESFVAWERTMGRLHPNDCSAGYVERFVRFTRDPHGRRS